MAKKKSTLINMLVALFVITAVSGGILGLVYGITKDAIAKVEKDKNDKAISEVFPLKNATYVPDTLKYTENGTTMYFPCTIVQDSTGATRGMAIKTSEGGFGGKIELMVGISMNDTITGTSVLSHSETPGLGANMTGKFQKQFVGMDPTTSKLKVTKDGGDVDAITAATITSRAFTKAVDKAYQAFMANKAKFMNNAPVVEKSPEEVEVPIEENNETEGGQSNE